MLRQQISWLVVCVCLLVQTISGRTHGSWGKPDYLDTWGVQNTVVVRQVNKSLYTDKSGSSDVAVRLRRQALGGAAGSAAGTAVGAAGAAAGAGKAAGWVGKVTGALNTVSGWAGAVGGVVSAVTGVIEVVNGIQQLALQRQQMKIQQQQFEQEFAIKTMQVCDQMCVTEWSPWGRCDVRCGGGTRSRNRQSYESKFCEGHPCRHSLEQEGTCNDDCPNRGYPRDVSGGGCTCQPGFTGDCCENEASCLYPGSPRYGELDGNFPSRYGGVVTYSCREGFAIVGDNYQVCQVNSTWSGDKPRCERVECGNPGAPLFGRLINSKTTYLYLEEAGYICDEGYTLVGPKMRTCKSIGEDVGRWTGFTPMCLPVDCGPPNLPLYGHHEGSEYTLGSVVTYSCSTGFRLVGSEERRCRPGGTWDGHETTCQAIGCEPPYPPENGALRRTYPTYDFGRTIYFRCDEGYTLLGLESARCERDPQASLIGPGGRWDAEPPTCKAVQCGDPGTVDDAAKSGSLHYYPHSVTYTCFAGFVIRGAHTLTCGSTGVWSSSTPSCESCPANTFKPDTDPDTPCMPCPAYSHTSGPAATSPAQCVCDDGFTKTPEGECAQIVCPALMAPPDGSLEDCGHFFGELCHFDCDAGYILAKGSASRQCQTDSTWTGSDAVCEACPKDTYKSHLSSCLPCPLHAHTAGEASEDCGCKDGYERSGAECVDIAECATNGGKGPCSEVCENKPGSYRCLCPRPGWEIDEAHDRNTCVQEQSCRHPGPDDAPSNGGLVCHNYTETNSKQCASKCNPGYQITSGVNDWETCGPPTGWKWLEPFRDCLEEHFPDYTMEGQSNYFVRACRDLTTTEQDDVKRKFAETLTEAGVCLDREDEPVCRMEDVDIICGRTVRRKRSLDGVEEDHDEIDFSFTVKSLKVSDKVVDCPAVCAKLKIRPDRCQALCLPVYKRFLSAAVQHQKRLLAALFQQGKARVTFSMLNRDFEPNAQHTEPVKELCGVGMVPSNGTCVACQPGTYLNKQAQRCMDCRRATHQDETRQTACKLCPPGTTTYSGGQAVCEACPEGRWGLACRQQCETPCVHGACAGDTGECACSSGWEGAACDTDIDGCAEAVCAPGAQCRDIPAPGTGYTCGAPRGAAGYLQM